MEIVCKKTFTDCVLQQWERRAVEINEDHVDFPGLQKGQERNIGLVSEGGSCVVVEVVDAHGAVEVCKRGMIDNAVSQFMQ